MISREASGNNVDHEFMPQGLYEAMRIQTSMKRGLVNIDAQGMERFKQRRWEEISGQKPEVSRVTILMPVRNEARALPFIKGALSTMILPGGLGPKSRLLIVTNHCSDESPEMAREIIYEQGDAKEEQLLGLNALTSERGGLKFTHIDYHQKGKASALTLGARIAIADNSGVLINIDANTFPAPESIAHIYGHAEDLSG